MIINKSGYLSRRTDAKVFRNWWLVKAIGNHSCGIKLKDLILPKHYLGKKLRFKVEVIEEGDDE